MAGVRRLPRASARWCGFAFTVLPQWMLQTNLGALPDLKSSAGVRRDRGCRCSWSSGAMTVQGALLGTVDPRRWVMSRLIVEGMLSGAFAYAGMGCTHGMDVVVMIAYISWRFASVVDDAGPCIQGGRSRGTGRVAGHCLR